MDFIVGFLLLDLEIMKEINSKKKIRRLFGALKIHRNRARPDVRTFLKEIESRLVCLTFLTGRLVRLIKILNDEAALPRFPFATGEGRGPVYFGAELRVRKEKNPTFSLDIPKEFFGQAAGD